MSYTVFINYIILKAHSPPARFQRFTPASENRPPSNAGYAYGQTSVHTEKSPTQRLGTSPLQANGTPSYGAYRGVSHLEGSKVSNLATSTSHLGQSGYDAKNPLKPSVGIKSNYF